MIDEAAGVSRFAGPSSQNHFQWRQWADHPIEFDKRGPDDGRDVQPGEPWPAQYQKRAENDEQYEREVGNENCVGGRSIRHVDG
jgi:hypothetical protein